MLFLDFEVIKMVYDYIILAERFCLLHLDSRLLNAYLKESMLWSLMYLYIWPLLILMVFYAREFAKA